MVAPGAARTVILGGGLAGLSAAWHLGDADYVLLEREETVGGLARTEEIDGFRFDYGPHAWWTQDAVADSLVKSLPGADLRPQVRSAWVHIYGRRVPAPFQANLHGLPPPVIAECLTGYLRAASDGHLEAESFAGWLRGRFGDGIYRHFMEPYNTKLWTVAPDELATDWPGARVSVPDPQELIEGALGLRVNALGPNAQFSYPARGGVEAIASALARECAHVVRRAQPLSVNLGARTLTLAGGTVAYERLISTIPLPALVALCEELPERERAAASALRATRVLLVNIGLKERSGDDLHWVYFPEPKYPFYRVTSPGGFADDMCPAGRGSLQAECAAPAAAGRVSFAALTESVLQRLEEEGYLSRSSLLFVRTSVVSPAYVICDHARRASLEVLLPYLLARGVTCCGRFGAWEYLNMDGCVAAGRAAARWADGEAWERTQARRAPDSATASLRSAGQPSRCSSGQGSAKAAAWTCRS